MKLARAIFQRNRRIYIAIAQYSIDCFLLTNQQQNSEFLIVVAHFNKSFRIFVFHHRSLIHPHLAQLYIILIVGLSSMKISAGTSLGIHLRLNFIGGVIHDQTKRT